MQCCLKHILLGSNPFYFPTSVYVFTSPVMYLSCIFSLVPIHSIFLHQCMYLNLQLCTCPVYSPWFQPILFSYISLCIYISRYVLVLDILLGSNPFYFPTSIYVFKSPDMYCGIGLIFDLFYGVNKFV